MKKLLALILALAMMFAFAACGDDEPEAAPQDKPGIDTTTQEPEVKEPEVKEPEANPALTAFLDTNKDVFLSSMLDSFTQSSGTTCKGDVRAEGNAFVVDIRIDGWNDISDDIKTQLQQAYDTMGTSFDDSLKQMQASLPELESFIVNVCEEDGDIVAVIHAGK